MAERQLLVPSVRAAVEKNAPPDATPAEKEDLIATLEQFLEDPGNKFNQTDAYVFRWSINVLGKLAGSPEFGSFLPDLALNIRMFHSPWLWIKDPLTSETLMRTFLILTLFEKFKRHQGVKYRLRIDSAARVSPKGPLNYVDQVHGIALLSSTQAKVEWLLEVGNWAKLVTLREKGRLVRLGEEGKALALFPQFVKWSFRGECTVELLCTTLHNEARPAAMDKYLGDPRIFAAELEELGFLPKEFLPLQE